MTQVNEEQAQSRNGTRLVYREEHGGALLYDLASWHLQWLTPADSESFLCSEAASTAIVHRRSHAEYLSAPLKVFISITAECNLKCTHCVVNARRNLVEDLGYDELCNILRQCGEIGVLEVRLSGGEPTLRTELPRIVSYAKSQNLSVSMNSNGVFPRRTCAALAESGIDRVHISLDGMEENNDRIRGNGVFRKCRSTIASLRAQGVYVRIVVSLDKRNVADVEALVAFANELDCDIKFSPIASVGEAIGMTTLLDADECLSLDGRLRRIPSRKNVFYNLGTLRTEFLTRCQLDDFDSTLCGLARTQLRVELSGDVYAAGCGDAEFGRTPLGRKEDRLDALWLVAQCAATSRMRQSGGACTACDLTRVFGVWLAGTSPSFNYRK